MAAQHEAEALDDHEPRYSPYGVAGQYTGGLAGILRDRLIAPGEPLPYGLGETPRWTDDDRLAFGYLLDFDDSLPALAKAMGEKSVRDRISELGFFEMAHPYSGAYWEWVKTARDAAWRLTPDEAYELVKRGGSFPYEEQFMYLRPEPSYVDRHYTSGEAFAHKWTTWRRGLAPEDDPIYHQDVRESLDAIIGHVLPNDPRPRP
jgi:hypothetical protein